MHYLMLMWADADAASGDDSDFQAWADFDAHVQTAGGFVLNGALAPTSADARLVRTAIAGHALGEAVQRRPFADGQRQIEAVYIIMDLPTWTPPWSGQTSCPPTAASRSADCCSSDLLPHRQATAVAEL